MGIVYFARESGSSNEFKIGHTKSSVATPRLTGLKRAGRPPLVLFRKIETESYLDVENYLHHRLHASEAPTGKEWFTITEAEAIAAYEDGVKIAKVFERHKRELEPLESIESTNGQVIEPSPEVKSLCLLIKQKTGQRDMLATEVELLRTDLKIAIGLNDGIKDLATWKVSSTARFNQTRLKEERPDIYEQFVVTTPGRSLRMK